MLARVSLEQLDQQVAERDALASARSWRACAISRLSAAVRVTFFRRGFFWRLGCILPFLGDYYFDALSSMAVQEWLNEASRKTKPNTTKRYDAETVFGWWRVLRTMVRDAVEQLGLPRDPTRRIIIPS